MKIVLMPNLTRKEAYSVTCGICKTLDTLGASYSFLPEYEAEFSSTKASFMNEQDALEKGWALYDADDIYVSEVEN